MPPMNKKQLGALIGKHIRVEGAHFTGDMTMEHALALMSGLQERLGTEAQGKSSQKWAFLDGLRELLTESLKGEANGERSCDLCLHDDSKEDFDLHDMGSTPLGGNKSEEEGSDEDDDDRCPGLKHVPAVLRQAVLIVVWRVLLVNRANNDVLLSELFGTLHKSEEEEEEEEKEVSGWKKMVELALDSVSIVVDVGHHDQATKGKAREVAFRLGNHKSTVSLKVSTLVQKGPELLQSLSQLTTLKSLFSVRFGSIDEVGIAGVDVLQDWASQCRFIVGNSRRINSRNLSRLRDPLHTAVTPRPSTDMLAANVYLSLRRIGCGTYEKSSSPLTPHPLLRASLRSTAADSSKKTISCAKCLC